MTIKDQLNREITIISRARGEKKITVKEIAEKSGINAQNLSRYLNSDDRGMSDRLIERLADTIGKRIVLIDKEEEDGFSS